MEYVSTRNKNIRVSAAQAIASGIASDGGLFCPAEIPTLTADEIKKLREMDYRARAAAILGKYLTDFTPEELKQYTQKAYTENKFGGQNTAPLKKLGENGPYVLELWHGPTCAFKDMALQILPYLLTSSLKKIGESRTVCILVATSGDTGKAALEGFSDVPGTKIMVYYPVDGVSAIQKLQMLTQEGGNVKVCAIQGNFDDAQTAVKRIFTDPQTMEKLHRRNLMLSSANSINWGRLAPQIVYYVSAYCDLLHSGALAEGQKVNFCVPTGNFGNILAAYFAMQMGVPVGRLICASNTNHVLTEFFTEQGHYNRKRPFYTTISPSMDILISSNLERLLFYISGQNDTLVKQWMEQLSEKGSYTVGGDIFARLGEVFAAGYCSDSETKETIAQFYQAKHYLCDPHTAVAAKVYQDYQAKTEDKNPTVLVSTASPYKFCKSVLEALGERPETDGFELFPALHQKTGVPIPAPLSGLSGKPVRFDWVVNKNDILSTVDQL